MLKAGIGFVLASGFVVLACSSSSSGTGTNNGKGGGLGGLLGGGSSSSSSSSSGGTTTGGQILPNTCSTSNEDACTTCAKTKCCNETLACRNDNACNTLVNCAVACGDDEACGQKCGSDNAAGKTNAQAFITCLQNNCATACSDSSGTGTGTNTGSGVDTSNCLSDPPDTTLCNGFQGRPVSHDCPNGSPGTSCVLQGQLSGIYCCPS